MTESLPVTRYMSMVDERERSRVLLLDGDDASRVVTDYALREVGFECIAVANAPAAFAAIDSFHPDAIVYEWWRTRCEASLAAELRARAARHVRAPRIIVLSTQDEPAGFRGREPIDEYFTKPFQPAVLARCLAKV